MSVLDEVTQKLYVPSPLITVERSASAHAFCATDPSDVTVAESYAGGMFHVTVLSLQEVSLTWKSPPAFDESMFQRRSFALVTVRVPTPDTVNLIRNRTPGLLTESFAEPKFLFGSPFLIIASAVGVKVSVEPCGPCGVALT